MRILFVTSTRIGDAVLSSGLLHHLVTAHPGAAVTVACGPPAAPLFEAVPGLERVIVMAKRRFSGHWLDFWRETVTRFWDQVVDLRGSPVTALIPHGARRSWRPMRAPAHRVVQLGRFLGLDGPAAPHLYVAPRHEDAARRLLPDGAPILALGPTANWPGKEWPVDRFTELARRLTAPGAPLHGARVAVFGGPAERAAAKPLLEALAGPRLFDDVGTHELMTSFACLKRARLYIGNDSGLMHMAAAAGVPVLGLFGPTDEVAYAPWGPHCAYLRTPESFKELVPPGFDFNIRHTLMGSLGVDEVERAARDLLARTEKAASCA